MQSVTDANDALTLALAAIDAEERRNEEADDLAPARGIVWGIALSFPLWGVAVCFACYLFGVI